MSLQIASKQMEVGCHLKKSVVISRVFTGMHYLSFLTTNSAVRKTTVRQHHCAWTRLCSRKGVGLGGGGGGGGGSSDAGKCS